MASGQNYQVLARKYRPQNFDALIGQEPMVQTLRNAFATGRIAHAFMLTGLRGIGKTTTARIIAMGLNCLSTEGPTTQPCGNCPSCQAIAEGRSIDVLELDAASNTQVDKMREILATVPYRPTEARYKVYIFDEVHMLSGSAFNALLKTLEEPPEHVKFIFATTEIKKVPVTVLSRTQRFDLRRVEPERMVAHLAKIAALEEAAIADEALRLIARAAEGSVRDALSLLDQAIAIGQGETSADNVRAMIGLADQTRVLALFAEIMAGDVSGALETLRALYHDGADPAAILKELAEITHFVSLIKVAEQLEDDSYSPAFMAEARDYAARLGLPVLARMWQMLLKLGAELDLAPNRLMGAEMAVIRLCHVSDEPPPGELLAKLRAGTNESARAKGAAQAGATPATPPVTNKLAKQVGGEDFDDRNTELARFARFEDVIALIRANRDLGLLIEVENAVRVRAYRPGRIDLGLTPDASNNLVQRLAQALHKWTGARWALQVEDGVTTSTIAEARAHHAGDILQSPIVQKFIHHFPKAEVIDITRQQSDIETSADPAYDDDWEAIDLEDGI